MSPSQDFRPGVTAEGHVLQPYLCAEHFLADLFDFREGDILYAPFRTPSLHPNTISTFRMQPIDTPQGSMYDTKRMMVVIKLYNDSMLCLPMFSFGFAGIAAVPQQYRQDYVGVKPEEELSEPEGFGGIPRIQFDCFGPKKMHPASLVHLLGAIHVRYNDDIVDIGRIPKESFEELMVHFQARQASEE